MYAPQSTPNFGKPPASFESGGSECADLLHGATGGGSQAFLSRVAGDFQDLPGTLHGVYIHIYIYITYMYIYIYIHKGSWRAGFRVVITFKHLAPVCACGWCGQALRFSTTGFPKCGLGFRALSRNHTP